MAVNITIVTHNRLELTKKCLASLLEKTRGEYRVTVVDNASRDGTREYLLGLSGRHRQVRVFLLRSNMGVSVAANLGWAEADAEYYVKLDNDIEILDSGWLENLVSITDADKSIAMASYLLQDWPCAKEPITLPGGQRFISSDLCNGGCVLIPRRIHERLGFWIEDHGKYGYEDKNYGDRALLAGFIIGYLPMSSPAVRHMGYQKDTLDPERETRKKLNVRDEHSGEKLYVFNKLLFEKGIRTLYVERRHIPRFNHDYIRFELNPSYLPLISLHNQYLSKLSYRQHDEQIGLNLSRLKAVNPEGL